MIILPLPPSANLYWRNYRGRMVVSTEATQYKADVAKLARLRDVECIGTGAVRVTMHMHFSTVAADLDNRIKVALDAMNGVFFTDDKQVTEIHAYKHIANRATAHIEIEVEAI